MQFDRTEFQLTKKVCASPSQSSITVRFNAKVVLSCSSRISDPVIIRQGSNESLLTQDGYFKLSALIFLVFFLSWFAPFDNILSRNETRR